MLWLLTHLKKKHSNNLTYKKCYILKRSVIVWQAFLRYPIYNICPIKRHFIMKIAQKPQKEVIEFFVQKFLFAVKINKIWNKPALNICTLYKKSQFCLAKKVTNSLRHKKSKNNCCAIVTNVLKCFL